jgi:hypothetical protein
MQLELEYVFLEINVLYVVCFLLGDSPASEFYVPTFRNTVSVASSQAGRYVHKYEVEMDRVFLNVRIQNSDAGESPRRYKIQNMVEV